MMWPFTKRRLVKPGVYHYTGKGDLEGKRIHLRVDDPEKGILIMDASRMMILNRTGLEFSYLILQGLSDKEIIRRILRFYRVKKKQVQEDLVDFKKEFYSLLSSTEIISNMEEDLSSLYDGQMAPYRMDLALTYRCNNDCGHCYNEKKSSKELTTEEWKKVLDKLWKMGVPHIIFTGGEPTLRDDLGELISHAESLGQITGMNTNGRKLKDKAYLKELLDAGLDHIQITVASHKEEVHDAIVGSKGAFKETIEGLKNTIGCIYTVTNTTIMEDNKDHILDTIDHIRKIGVEHIAVNSLIRSGKGKDAKGIEIHELKRILEKGRDRGFEEDYEFRWYTPTPYCKLNPMEMELGMKQCSACRLNMAVEPDGGVIPCQSYYEQMGNILTDKWEKIWNHSTCKNIRDRKDLPKECKDCDLHEVCGGGCPLSWSEGDYICRNILSS
jgi:radical SAM protein with 4Fe4S-binding SPASM domain